MRRRFQMLAALVLVAAAAWSRLAVAQRPSADDQGLKTEVNAFMDQYWDLWSAGRIDQLVERVYHPFGQLSNQGHSSIEQLKAAFPRTRTALVSAGYGRSQMPNRNVCILSPTVAIVSGRGMRYLTDGKVMGEYGWTYTLIKGADGWRMVSIYSHDPNRALICSS
jgi:hypothetical protein